MSALTATGFISHLHCSVAVTVSTIVPGLTSNLQCGRVCIYVIVIRSSTDVGPSVIPVGIAYSKDTTPIINSSIRQKDLPSLSPG